MSEEKMREAFEKWRKSDERKNWDTIDSSFAATEQFYFDAGYKAADELEATLQESEAGLATAKQKYDECMSGNQELSAIERLRFFCSLAMNGQDWLDVESFFDDLAAPPSAQAIETAAIMKCAEVVRNTYAKSTQSPDESGTLMDAALAVEALIPQDGRTKLEQKCMEVAHAILEASQVVFINESDIREIIQAKIKGEGK